MGIAKYHRAKVSFLFQINTSEAFVKHFPGFNLRCLIKWICLFLKKSRLKKFLIIRLSSIGDIVLTTPIIRCLKTQVEGAQVHYLTRKQFYPVLESNPYIDKIHTVSGKMDDVISELKQENFDLIIDLHKNLRTKKIKLKLKKANRTFNKINVRKWLIVNFKINSLPNVHIVDRYFQAVNVLGVTNDGQGLDYVIPEKDNIDISTLPESHQSGYIGWVVGGNHSTKIFPADKIIEVIAKIETPVVLLGGPGDVDTGNAIARAYPGKVYNACGVCNINQSASLVKNARMILTNDTGLMHIAAAFGKKLISFWGNTIPQFGMTPYMPGKELNSEIVEITDLPCRPCSKIGFSKCPKNHFKCMKDIQADQVVDLIDKFDS